MLSVVTQLFARRAHESRREHALSNQVDQLEYELAIARRERDAARIRLDEERTQFEQHRLRDYPAANWVGEIRNQDLFNPAYPNAVEQVLADVTNLGYDVSAAWMMHRAALDMIAQYQADVSAVQATVCRMRSIKVRYVEE